MPGKMCSSIGVFGIFLILAHHQALVRADDEICDDALGQPGHCIPYSACKPFLNLLLRSDYGIERVSKYTFKSVCRFEHRKTTVCCPDYGNINLDYNTTANDICEDALGQRGLCIPVKACKPLVDLILLTDANEKVTKYTVDSVCIFEHSATTVCCPNNGNIDLENDDDDS